MVSTRGGERQTRSKGVVTALKAFLRAKTPKKPAGSAKKPKKQTTVKKTVRFAGSPNVLSTGSKRVTRSGRRQEVNKTSLFKTVRRGKMTVQKPRKYRYSGLKEVDGKKWHSRRHKIYQGQYYHVGLKNADPRTEGLMAQRKIPHGFAEFTKKRNALIALLARRAGLSGVDTYANFLRTAKNANMSRTNNLGFGARFH